MKKFYQNALLPLLGIAALLFGVALFGQQVSAEARTLPVVIALAVLLPILGMFLRVRPAFRKRLQKLRPVYASAEEAAHHGLPRLRRSNLEIICNLPFFTRNTLMRVGLKNGFAVFPVVLLLAGLAFQTQGGATNIYWEHNEPKTKVAAKPEAACTLTITDVSVG